MASDKKITDQYNSFVQQTLTRLQAEVDTERDERKAEVAAVRATLAKLAWVLFSAFLALVGTGLAIVLFPKT